MKPVFILLLALCAPAFALVLETSEGEVTIPDTRIGFTSDDDELPFLSKDCVTDICYETPLTHFPFTNLLFVPPFGKFILVDCEHQRLWAFQDGVIIAYFIVSTGRSYLPTRVGDYTIGRKLLHAYSNIHVEGGQNKWWRMGFYQDINYLGGGFHALPSLWDSYQETINDMGVPVSHKCVRLGHIPLDNLGGISPAQWLFDFAEEGDDPFSEGIEKVGTPIKVIGIYRHGTRVEEDHLPTRKFSPEKGFYLETEESPSLVMKEDK